MQIYSLKQGDLEVELIPFGASLSSVKFKGQQVLRQIPYHAYAQTKGHFGSIAGPIANRIGGAKVMIQNTEYHLDQNEGQNTLHGGHQGLGLRQWSVVEQGIDYIIFEIKLDHLELGLPGDRIFRCCYRLIHDSSLNIDLTMTTNHITLCNLAPHPYFCLDDTGTVLEHHLQIFADHYLPKDSEQLPTGEIKSVQHTRFDFRSPKKLAQTLIDDQLSLDHNFCFTVDEPQHNALKNLACLSSERSKISLSISSNQKGLQVYTPFQLGEPTFHDHITPQDYPAICLEPQAWPDSPRFEHFGSILVDENQPYLHKNQFKFTRLK